MMSAIAIAADDEDHLNQGHLQEVQRQLGGKFKSSTKNQPIKKNPHIIISSLMYQKVYLLLIVLVSIALWNQSEL